MTSRSDCILNLVEEKNRCFQYDKKEAEILTITAVALIGISLVSLGLLSHFSVITGINTTAQLTLFGTGSTALLASFSCCCVKRFSFRKKAETLSSVDLRQRIERILTQECDPIAELKRLAKSFTIEQLQTFIKEDYPESLELMEAARAMIGQARNYLEAREALSPSGRTRLRGALDKMVVVLDSIFSAFGISTFFEPAENRFEGDFKFQKIMMIISLFTLLTATLLPIFGVTTGSSIVGGTLLLIMVFSVIWPRIRPLPSTIREGENWSKQIREGKLGKVKGRPDALDTIAHALSSKRHPLIIGPSGVGKTQTVLAFTKAIEEGRYPQLSGKTVFYFNTANLVQSREMFGGGNKILNVISRTIDRHREECILVFDEIHIAYQSGKNAVLGEQLKTFLDEKEGNFPYVIGLTTQEEYYRDIFKDNAAGDRRFEKIEIGNTDKNETIGVLSRLILEEAPDALLEEGILEYLYAKTEKNVQPLTALNILRDCISKLRNYVPPTSKILSQKQEELDSLNNTAAAIGSASLGQEVENRKKIEQLEKELSTLKTQVRSEQEALLKVKRLRQRLLQTRVAKFQAALELTSQNDEKRAKLFALLKYFFEKTLESHLRTTCEKAGMKGVIDQELVQGILDEEEANIKKREEALRGAHISLELRKMKKLSF
ncbi:MAG: AAA family ATPase [Chlamydiales bacterium]|nr:AAA family ATPase [Chlamydiales bacterium]